MDSLEQLGDTENVWLAAGEGSGDARFAVAECNSNMSSLQCTAVVCPVAAHAHAITAYAAAGLPRGLHGSDEARLVVWKKTREHGAVGHNLVQKIIKNRYFGRMGIT